MYPRIPNVREGLSSNSVYCTIAQTSEGNMKSFLCMEIAASMINILNVELR